MCVWGLCYYIWLRCQGEERAGEGGWYQSCHHWPCLIVSWCNTGVTDIYSDTCLSPDSAQLSDSLRHSGKWAGDVLLDEAQTIYIKLMYVACWVMRCHVELIKSPKGFLHASGVGIKQWLSPLSPRFLIFLPLWARHRHWPVITQLSQPTFLSLIHQNWLIGTYLMRNEEKINISSHHQWVYNYPHLVTAKHILMITQHAGNMRSNE